MLGETLLKLDELAKWVNETAKADDRHWAVPRVHSRFVLLEEQRERAVASAVLRDLVCPSRSLLRSSSNGARCWVLSTSRFEPREVFLFNDLLLLARGASLVPPSPPSSSPHPRAVRTG